MGEILILIISVGIIMLLSKKFNVRKNAIIKATIAIIAFGIVIIIALISFLTLFYKNRPTITQEERNQSIAILEYVNIMGIDASTYVTYYIYKNDDDKYYYYKTSSSITVAGPQEEKINKKGKIKNRNHLEKIINSLEDKVSSENKSVSINGNGYSAEGVYVTISYNGSKIEKDELLNKLFN